jgi:iron-sulfur cluster repair protein YtfE (RIC family)
MIHTSWFKAEAGTQALVPGGAGIALLEIICRDPPIRVMRDEHIGHGAHLERLSELTREHTAPAGACNTWRALYAGTSQLAEDLISHIHLENNLLFPAFQTAR